MICVTLRPEPENAVRNICMVSLHCVSGRTCRGSGAASDVVGTLVVIHKHWRAITSRFQLTYLRYRRFLRRGGRGPSALPAPHTGGHDQHKQTQTSSSFGRNTRPALSETAIDRVLE